MPLSGLFGVPTVRRAVDLQDRLALENLEQMVAIFVIFELGVDGVRLDRSPARGE